MGKESFNTMAKYTRFDARNKKNAKHKKQSLNKDIRIRKITSKKKDIDRVLHQAKTTLAFNTEV